MFKVIANLDLHTPLSEVADAARRAERLGFDRLSIPDVCQDGLIAAAIAVGATQRIEIANSALVCFPRSPMTTAVAVWGLQDYARGRYRLGLGPLVAANIVQKYSTPWHAPAPRMREYVLAMQSIFRCWQYGEPLRFEGKHYSFTRQQAYVAPPPIEYPEVPLHLAAVGPRMIALAGELADAVTAHPTNTSARFIREVLQRELEVGAAHAGRSAADVGVIVNPLIASGSSMTEVVETREGQRKLLATILSTPNYWRSLELFGRADLGPKLRQLTREGRWNEMSLLLGDELLDEFLITAAWTDLAAALKENYRGIAAAVAIPLPRDPANDARIAPIVESLAA